MNGLAIKEMYDAIKNKEKKAEMELNWADQEHRLNLELKKTQKTN
jgi:hypothetical protein